MLGSLIGDIAGSIHEFSGNKDPHVPLFPPPAEITDDSILTLATAEVLLTGRDYASVYREFGRLYPEPMGGYGARFQAWLWAGAPAPYNSWGNGSAMRVGPIGWVFDAREAVLREAARSAAVTHDHPEGIKGAQAVALAVFMARQGASQADVP
jgi:ADP-ribosylglycohydrolase